MTYAIRPARADDLERLRTIEYRAAALFRLVGLDDIADGEPSDPHFLRAVLRHGRIAVAVDAADQPVGLALAGILDDALHLYELSVDPHHGRRGLGRQLVTSIEAHAIECGLPALTLSTFRHVPWNGPFYARLGFAEVARADWTPAFHLLHARERDMSLPVEQRMFMRKALG
ncbi:GNAT family N-acetyltransferase [Kaistia dalseonensis]|uniref:Ribosomal protein S18 acetylase RimI-like enzyme n=1 Tax=Kaistia dalseonensis TaxID=410840 RepID=A0ABU0H390_9HYPH|nr:GNAT family N-acetyltransferase [Kaistia dalseonensis]MCX5494184.1 GNAT family N-acetyltransferase [Kaistia dalseonensis]MDQ0436763.1 ribosomal protein S18 acetylase RimI-like enzyme [Kaistia dalseonensis]